MTAITAIAVVVTALVAIKDYEQEAALRRRERGRSPYLRLDVAFTDSHERHFRPPETTHIYSLDEVGQAHAFGSELRSLVPSRGESGHDLVLWTTNLQTEPLAIADRISARLLMTWRVNPGDEPTSVAVTVHWRILRPVKSPRSAWPGYSATSIWSCASRG